MARPTIPRSPSATVSRALRTMTVEPSPEGIEGPRSSDAFLGEASLIGVPGDGIDPHRRTTFQQLGDIGSLTELAGADDQLAGMPRRQVLRGNPWPRFSDAVVDLIAQRLDDLGRCVIAYGQLRADRRSACQQWGSQRVDSHSRAASSEMLDQHVQSDLVRAVQGGQLQDEGTRQPGCRGGPGLSVPWTLGPPQIGSDGASSTVTGGGPEP